jgi:hypothetical protein
MNFRWQWARFCAEEEDITGIDLYFRQQRPSELHGIVASRSQLWSTIQRIFSFTTVRYLLVLVFMDSAVSYLLEQKS